MSDAMALSGIEADVLKAVALSQRISKKAAELADLTAKLDALNAKIAGQVRPLTLAAVEALVPAVDVNAEIAARLEAGKAARRAERVPGVLPSTELGRIGRQHDRNN